VTLDRPAADAPAGDWHAYLHLRDNPAGPTRELWYHGGGCGAWLVVSRNTATHAVSGAVLASEARHAG
jgi:sarcosine oxidase subunit delta